ncbi:hypothetical protein QQS21_005933 [Conoideocrella luteorostrata]|uniref:Uncharacterized protein n=1 Tax=Conoideocrella luteorostrata TaxID=1105319 RepID=A0AAJ0FTY7_9HYPO|nr:hypothetical protein QQS21_005933 [Conoideocrella luteorostrata]
MCYTNLLRSWVVSVIALSHLVVGLEHLNVTWPPAHYSWVAVKNGFTNKSAQMQFQNESTSGNFCRDRSLPPGVERVPFPLEGGRLEFKDGLIGKTPTEYNWTVNVLFDSLRSQIFHGLQDSNQIAFARPSDDWRWKDPGHPGQSYCSNGLRAIENVTVGSDPVSIDRGYALTPNNLIGMEGTLASETIRHGRGPGSEENITTVIRQCTFIRFTPVIEVKDPGPCGISIPSPVYVLTPVPSTDPDPGAHDDNSGTSFAVLVTLAAVFGVAIVVTLIAIFLQRRRKLREKQNLTGRPVFDARAARLAKQQKESVLESDYGTDNYKHAKKK